jgi:ADP-ribose pyrophosphatase
LKQQDENVVEERPWRVLSSESLHQNPYFSILKQHVTVRDRKRQDYYTIHFPRPAVGVVARRGTDVLLLRQYRFLVDEFVWAIPSGGVAEGESLEQAAAREFREETGYAVGSLKPLLSCYASYGCSNQRFEIFLATDIGEIKNAFDETEVISVRWFSRREVLDLVRHNGIVDNLSLSPILLTLMKDLPDDR